MSVFENYAFVYFVCEGKNEEATLRWIHENHKIAVNKEKYSLDFLRTRGKRSWEELRKRCFEYDYGGNVAIFYLLDSKSEERKSLKSKYSPKEIPVIKVLTPPEIEILLILSNPMAEQAWHNASRKNRQLKPSEFCKSYFNCNIKNGDNFIRGFGSFSAFEYACKRYKSSHLEQVCIYDILKLDEN